MDDRQNISVFEKAAETIRRFAGILPDTPGVYRMIGPKDEVLYVGKAKSLKKRVLSYAALPRLPVRIQRMVVLTTHMEFVHTHTEAEALLLESNLIKKFQPRYNVLLRDDKSFPYILLTGNHDYPTIVKHRGAQSRKGEYFGPFAGAGDVNRTIALLQRIFMLRNCTDSYFAQRKRPCLQYHIKRCTAPCVNMVSKEQYREQIAGARDFLHGKSRAVQARMQAAMEQASAAQDYELAAEYRDRIQALTSIQSRQDINVRGVADADIFALAQKHGKSCVQVFFFRGGQNFGNRSYFPRHDAEEKPGAILLTFIAQFYTNKPVPKEIIASVAPEDCRLLQQALSDKEGRKIRIIVPARGTRGRLLDFVTGNAAAALERHLAESAGEREILEKVAALLNLEEAPDRIEVYDNSHMTGTNMTGAMIVAGAGGFQKNSYRKFNIKEAGASDDYAMMREVLKRRFARAMAQDADAKEEQWPDIVLIDGGQGQYNAAKEILQEMGIFDSLKLVAIAKGKDRNAGREKFFTEGKEFQLPPGDPALHYFQRIRDEAHRFAVASHRVRRKMDITRSPLDEIPGIGAARKKALLQHFGSAKAVADAGVEDLYKVEGVSRAMARKIYEYFH
ncbi:MAG: excinuclease ABC subunit UvrC [Alphaproteobacteria bacterium]|nr:excinuclease ABC subunit UvrC [Alphaproteobacteria bacterium]